MKKIVLGMFITGLVGLFASVSWAIEKDQYHLFNPVPASLMRDMSTDRPDKTESPYSVDAGHFQMETSLVDYTYNTRNSENNDVRVDGWNTLPINLKAGLLNNVDLQLVMNPYINERSEGDGEKSDQEGFGDIQTRLKVNLWGNDGGVTALAIMPFVKFPTNTGELGNKAYESGIIVPLAVSLPAGWDMGLMTEFDFNRNEEKDYYTDFINTVTFGHQIIGSLDGYIEFFSSVNKDEASLWVGTIDLGLTYAVSKDIQLDGGVNVGVTNSADDFNPFIGLSVRY